MPFFTRRSRQDNNSSRSPVIESLESRAYLSSGLLVTFPGALPASEISGHKANLHVSVNLANEGPNSFHGPFTITLFASTDQTLSSDDSQLAQGNAGPLTILSEHNRTFHLTVKSFPVNLDNNYYILAEVSSTGAVGSTTSTIQILPPTVDLSDTVLQVREGGHIGHKLPVAVTVMNDGNVNARGTLFVAFGASQSEDGSSPYTLGTLHQFILIRPGHKTTLHFLVQLPTGMPSGNQFITATVDPSDLFNDPNLANNFSVSPNPVSVT